eukprot:GFUD01005780.1.p1 GENE.GFUD01005780.1~~GFUD01005780.1.p1  ORF type:complete len:453 (-),score=128.18 GFUD01005780.1:40-1398(-)
MLKKMKRMDTEENTFIRLRGLVWNATEEDIKGFLKDCTLKEVVLLTNGRGKPSGNAFVHLDTESDVDRAIAHNKEYLRERFVIVEEIFKSQYISETQNMQNNTAKRPSYQEEVKKKVISKEMDMEYNKGEQDKRANKTNFHIILRGLPWKATEDEIAEFLDDCDIVGNVVIINNEAGKPSGDAVLQLLNKIDLERALKYDRKYLLDRCVIVEETDKDNYNKHIRKLDKADTEENTFIRLRGLVWSATEEDIKTFLHDCNVKEVVLTTNDRGRPTGNAFVHLDTEADVEKAMAHNREYLRERFVLVEEIYESQYIRETKEFVSQTGNVNKKSETELEGNLENGKEAKRRKTEKDKIADHMECNEEEQGNANQSLKNVKKACINFEIRPIGNVAKHDVIEECKAIKIEGVIWEEDNDDKAKIIMGCSIANPNVDAEMIKEKIKHLNSVEDVIFS